MSSNFSWLVAKRFRGWPWPEGLNGIEHSFAMYGADGLCLDCGVPNRSQIGPLRLQRRSMTVAGIWEPHWCDSLLCAEETVAFDLAEQFDLRLMEVGWPKPGGPGAFQIVVPIVGEPWFDQATLARVVQARHPLLGGETGNTCATCGTWRWYGCESENLPAIQYQDIWADHAIVASPEVFGSGWQSMRKILVRDDPAERIVAASPRDFTTAAVRWID